jgi:hypothetical protein
LGGDLEGRSGRIFDWERPSFYKKVSEDFGWATSRSDDEPSGGDALRFMRIFVKWRLTVY